MIRRDSILRYAQLILLLSLTGSLFAQTSGNAGPAVMAAPTTASPVTIRGPAGDGSGSVPSASSGGDSTQVNPESGVIAPSVRNAVAAPTEREGIDATDALPVAPRAAAVRAAAATSSGADETEFQRFVKAANGQSLPLFGYNLFARGPLAAVKGVSVPANYLLGPGDEIILQTYGMINLAMRLVVDREGRVYIPKVGPITLAGLAFGDTERVLSAHLGKMYREFGISVTMGQLRNIEIFVVGQAKQIGKLMVSGLATLINALLETGGPNSNGTLRSIELRRSGKLITKLDVYRFLVHGDDNGDVRLQSGDVIVIPAAGPRVALLGTVNLPAVYELLPGETIARVLELSGGLSVLAAPQKVQLERINPVNAVARSAEYFGLDAAGMARQLQTGDVLTIFQISPKIADVVTLQGNVAAPMRYSWKQGMRVSDLLSDRQQLIPSAYWQRLNAGATNASNPSRPEVNLDYAVVQRLDTMTLRTRLLPFSPSKAIAQDERENLLLEAGDVIAIYRPGESGPDTNETVTVRGSIVGGVRRFVWRPGFKIKDIIPSAEWLVEYYNYWQRRSGRELYNDINWSYAQVVRRVPATLQIKSIQFNLADAVLQDSEKDNLQLEPGDQITLYTTHEMPVPLAKRVQLVTLGGEVEVPGIYQIASSETLQQLIQRAGGFTSDAYVFGLDLRRDASRLAQQEGLDRVIQKLETRLATASQGKLQNVLGAEQLQSAQVAAQFDQVRLANLRKLKASGRLALNLDPERPVLPTLVLEDGDTVTVPSRPAFVGVFGAVNNDNSLLWSPGFTFDDAVKLAGATATADVSESYVLRADGTLLSNAQLSGMFWSSGIGGVALQPGDTVVVAEKSDRESFYTAFIRGAKDITSILYQFGIGAAALKTLRN